MICIQNKCIKCIISIYSIVEKQDLKPAGIDQQLIFISGYEMFVGILNRLILRICKILIFFGFPPDKLRSYFICEQSITYHFNFERILLIELYPTSGMKVNLMLLIVVELREEDITKIIHHFQPNRPLKTVIYFLISSKEKCYIFFLGSP